MDCDTGNIAFPMQADIFYAMNEQSAYGNVLKSWYYETSIVCNFVFAGNKFKEEILPNILISQDSLLIGRAKKDFRMSLDGTPIDSTNIAITNIRDKHCNEIYIENGGPRAGKSTVYEIATFQPFINPFGKTEHYSIVLKRSENQEFSL